MNWKTTISFVLSASLLIVIVGWLTTAEVLPIQQNIQYSDTERSFIQVWLWIAIAIGVILPSMAWVVWSKNPQARRILGFYLLVPIVQIVMEQLASSIGIPSLVATIGTIYTAFRLWQLWQGQQLMYEVAQNSSNHKLIKALLWLLGLFWFSNAIVLLTLGWSSVLS